MPIIELVCWWLVIMKISLNWLRDYVQTPLGPEQIAQTLSDLGFPCEGIDHLEDDTVIDLEITSNRGDCLGHIAIARELAAATGSELKMPDVQLDQSDRDVAEFASVEIADPRLCPRYTARMVEAVKVGPSPAWMVKRLEAVGMRSVNNVVDATNYAMMETGQPPHAFDYAKIAAGRIVVRRARAGERIVSIDGTMCNLEPDMLVIADANKPVAIAGVMGGLETEVSEATTTILLEDASFDPVSVRTTSRRLGLASEAAFRFERGVDIQMIDWASKRTCKLITQVAGGKVIRGVVDVYPGKPTPKQVRLRLSRLKMLLGTEIPQQEVIRILAALSFEPRLDGQVVVCSVPSWRADVYREVDLIEEVARELDRPPLLLLDPEGRAYGAFGVFVLPCVVVVKDGRVAAGLGWSLQLPERLAGEVAVCLGERSRREVEEELRPRPQKPAQRLEAERFLRLALVMEQRGMLASAEEAARKAVEADGEFGAAWVELARICLREGKLQDARRALRRALELCPESPDARLVSAQLKAEEGKPREALAELRELSLREPRNPYLYRLMGQIYERLGMCPEALRSYKRALDLNEHYRAAREALDALPV